MLNVGGRAAQRRDLLRVKAGHRRWRVGGVEVWGKENSIPENCSPNPQCVRLCVCVCGGQCSGGK